MELTEKVKILVADDEPLNIKSIYDALASENYQIITATNGFLAFELAVKHKPDAIIMDWDMPEKTGLEAVKLIRANKDTMLIPIIMATGKMTTTENLKVALEAGANDYIRKPIDEIEIIARIKSMISLNKVHLKNAQLQQEITDQQIAILNYRLELNNSALMAAKLRHIENAEFHNQYIDTLLSLKNHITPEGWVVINEVISNCKANIQRVNWAEFEQLFENTHSNFYEQLQLKFPTLSSNDRKLCAMIKLHLSNKEISAITNQSVETIKKAKYRLKLKFDVESTDSLYHFIQEIN